MARLSLLARLSTTTIIILVNTIYQTVTFTDNTIALPTTCLDHYLAGQHNTDIRRITIDQLDYGILCQMPAKAKVGEKSIVTTVIHNGLELMQTIESNTTIEYQIGRGQLRRLLDHMHPNQSDIYCEQSVTINWPTMSNISTEKMPKRTIWAESLFGRTVAIQDSYHRRLIGADAGIVHLFMIDDNQVNRTPIRVQFGALICRQNVDPFNVDNCQFNNRIDTIIIQPPIDSQSIQFVFRTDQHDFRLFSIVNRVKTIVNVDVNLGYLLQLDSSGITHPVGFLADGHYHRVHIDLRNHLFYIDELSTAIRFVDVVSSDVDVYLGAFNGYSMNIRVDNSIECRNSKHLTITKSSFISMVPPLCSLSNTIDYCSCSAPKLVINDTYSICRSSTEMDEYTSGLLIYGVNTIIINNNNSMIATTLRMQVHFVGDRITIAICQNNGNTMIEYCKICDIIQPNGFATNNWHRLSIFFHRSNHYMTLNKQICRLQWHTSFDNAVLYNLRVSNGLLIGGVLTRPQQYAGGRFINDLSQLSDNTLEKPPSLQGCIAEITIDGTFIQLDSILIKQTDKFTNTNDRNLFAIESNCASCNCVNARCMHDGQCNCASILQHANDATGDCDNSHMLITDNIESLKIGIIKMKPSSTTIAVHSVGNLSSSSIGRIDRIWVIFRPPTFNVDFLTWLTIGGLTIGSGVHGQQLKVALVDQSLPPIFVHLPSSTIDRRYHLLLIERDAQLGSLATNFSIRIDTDRIMQVDQRSLHNMDIIQLHQLAMVASEHDRYAAGCISDIGYSFINTEHDQTSQNHWNIDVKRLFVALFRVRQEIDTAVTIDCGAIRDDYRWNSTSDIKSSTYGLVRKYRFDEDKKGSHGLVDDERTFIWLVLLLILLVILLLFLIGLIIFFAVQRRRMREHNFGETNLKRSELRPLKMNKIDDEGNETTEINKVTGATPMQHWTPIAHPEHGNNRRKEPSSPSMKKRGSTSDNRNNVDRIRMQKRASGGGTVATLPPPMSYAPMANVDETIAINL